MNENKDIHFFRFTSKCSNLILLIEPAELSRDARGAEIIMKKPVRAKFERGVFTTSDPDVAATIVTSSAWDRSDVFLSTIDEKIPTEEITKKLLGDSIAKKLRGIFPKKEEKKAV